MIQDFTLPASPAAARRILQLAKRVRVEVDPAIEALARTGLVTNVEFEACPVALQPRERKLVQFLVDCQLRGVVLSHKRHYFHSVAHAVHLADAYPIVVFGCSQFMAWRIAAAGTEMQLSTIVADERYQFAPDHKLIIYPTSLGLNANLIRDTRHGTLLVEMRRILSDELDLSLFDHLGIEYPRTILAVHTHSHEQPTKVEHMHADLQHFLYEDGVASLIAGVKVHQRELVERGFQNPHPKSMAPLANISTHLLP